MAIGDIPVSDLMTSDVYTITPTMTVREVIEMFIEEGISGAPIVSNTGQVLSVVSQSNLIKLAAKGALDETIQSKMSEFTPEKKLIAVTRQQTFKDVFKLFLTNRVRRIIVVDGSGKLNGIISRTNMLKTFIENN